MNEKGFTLIEIIISVAALAILSVFLVQLFIQGNNFNIKAYELDQSVVLTQNILEYIEQADTPLMPANELYDIKWIKGAEGYDSTIYLNDDFNAVDSKGSAAYVLDIHVKSLEEPLDSKSLYQLSFDISRLKALPLEDAAKNKIYSLTATKLLKSWGL